MKILKKKMIEVIEGDFKLEKILEADEVFLTGTASEIIKVNKIEKKSFHKFEITNLICDEFERIKKNYK